MKGQGMAPLVENEDRVKRNHAKENEVKSHRILPHDLGPLKICMNYWRYFTHSTLHSRLSKYVQKKRLHVKKNKEEQEEGFYPAVCCGDATNEISFSMPYALFGSLVVPRNIDFFGFNHCRWWSPFTSLSRLKFNLCTRSMHSSMHSSRSSFIKYRSILNIVR